MIKVRIADGTSGRVAKVTKAGGLAQTPPAFDLTKFQELSIADTAFNFYSPRPQQKFVITGMRIKANRAVSNTVDATIIVYEAEQVDTTTVGKVLHEEALIRGEGATLLPINLEVAKGKWINAKTDDASVFITILGFFTAA